MTGSGRQADRLKGLMNDPRYFAYISYFNKDQDYFECHEVMEELWLEEGRSPLLQGLVQVALGLHHWDNGNVTGAVKLMTSALNKLTVYADDVILGLDMVSLRANLKSGLEALTVMGAPFEPFRLEVKDQLLARAVTEWEAGPRSLGDEKEE
ncbi:DUF309 domain-containing protein [Cohnella abietis]|uniref:DUF309 domain-containing protein n=1 Tax=Cohnella abietis TaxID=2507935 RepID=A0A3T1D3K2_9BACL|nr:DUF309 domain-containing protein [Cohnella abietis]BBI32618.1 hypothetical protein KCTCHS21_20170 [Cohnella abietis]